MQQKTKDKGYERIDKKYKDEEELLADYEVFKEKRKYDKRRSRRFQNMLKEIKDLKVQKYNQRIITSEINVGEER